jgi:hypothetical protein
MKTIVISTLAFVAVAVSLVSLIPTPKTQAVNPGYQTFQYVR